MGKQKDAINAKILKDVKFPMMLDTFDLCTSELQEKLVSMRTKFKDYEDFIVGQVGSVKSKGDTWIECNDDDVNPIHVEDVMKLSGGGDWHTAYVLLYGPRKLPKDFKKPSEQEDSKTNEEKMET